MSYIIRYKMPEWIGQLEMHAFVRHRVDEGDGLRLEIQAIGLSAIELVTQDRTAKAFVMGTMHAQLMCPSCVWP